jgi:predicted GNAT family acetyltransferase
VLDTAAVRVLTADDLAAALAVTARDPVANVFVASRLHAGGLGGARLGAEVWGYEVDGRLESLCYVGANVVPVEAGVDAVRAFAARAARQSRRCSSIVGRVDAVGPFWARVAATWGPARDVRVAQPLMAIDGAPEIEPDPRVRLVEPGDFDILMPACVAMFTEEVGVSPLGNDGGALYRSRIRELIEARRAYARIEGRSVVFKAEIGAATDAACQVQGVWVAPEYRGLGIAATGMATVVEAARRDIAPVVSLYVNDFNVRALAAYRRVGFREVGTFMSVLF